MTTFLYFNTHTRCQDGLWWSQLFGAGSPPPWPQEQEQQQARSWRATAGASSFVLSMIHPFEVILCPELLSVKVLIIFHNDCMLLIGHKLAGLVQFLAVKAQQETIDRGRKVGVSATYQQLLQWQLYPFLQSSSYLGLLPTKGTCYRKVGSNRHSESHSCLLLLAYGNCANSLGWQMDLLGWGRAYNSQVF